MIKTIEIERFSLTSSQPFDQVVTALKRDDSTRVNVSPIVRLPLEHAF